MGKKNETTTPEIESMMTPAITGLLMAYESGDLSDAATLDLFAGLVATGMAWSLQGHYGRTAAGLIENGLLTADGDITNHARELLDGHDLGLS